MSTPGYRFSEVSNAIEQLSQELSKSGQEEAATRLVRAAALVELESEELQACWGGPMNGQENRQAVVLDLLRRIPFDAIVETGTYRGLTTSWFATHFSGPVLSCEAAYKYFLQAQERLRPFPNVRLALSDSRAFLKQIFAKGEAGKTAFFYLDAHWEDDLPLREEIDLIFSQDIRAVVMIDDFQVPGDAGYSYDDYGPGKALTLDILDMLRGTGRLFFFPAVSSDNESGARRGFCIVTNKLDNVLLEVPSLRGADWEAWKEKQRMLDKEGDMVEVRAARDAIAELVHAQSAELREMAAMQQAHLTQAFGQVSELSASTSAQVAASLKAWDSTLRSFLESIDDKRDLGREIVELRAANLDLKRQLHRAELTIQQLQQSLETAEEKLATVVAAAEAATESEASAAAAEGGFPETVVESPTESGAAPSRLLVPGEAVEGPARREEVSLLPALNDLRLTLGSLSRSRALNALSAISSRPKATLGQASSKLDAIIEMELARTARED